MKHLLIIDDEHGSRESLRTIFEKNYDVSLAASAVEGIARLSEKCVDLVLLDVVMPEKDGISMLKEIQSMYPDVPVIMVSASTSVQPVVEAIRVGAYDFVIKPFDVQEIRRLVTRALESSSLHRQVEVLQTEMSREYPTHGIIGRSPSFLSALGDARKAAEPDATVLICGESGTGKELVARSVHEWSSRHDEPFVAVHCASLPDTLMESELFGHEKGAFTGADKMKPGRFDLAGSGTLFFDEVSEMSLATQIKLLRVLQEREFMRVGGTRVIHTNARIIAATGKNLKQEVGEERFRDDLYYRLSVVPIILPPLNERGVDIPTLAHHFFDFFKKSLNVTTTGISAEAMEIMCRYEWPGNVRELRNIIERMLVLHGKCPQVLAEHLPDDLTPGNGQDPPSAAGRTLAEAVSSYERQLITQALTEADGIQTHAARTLGTTRRILKYRMEKLNINATEVAST